MVFVTPDLNRYAKAGDKFTLRVEGKAYEATVKEVSVSDFERKYLVVVPSTGEALWVGNKTMKAVLFRN